MFRSALSLAPRRWLLTAVVTGFSLAAVCALRAANGPGPDAPTPATANPPNAGAAYTAAIKVTGPTTQFHDSVAGRYNYAFGKIRLSCRRTPCPSMGSS